MKRVNGIVALAAAASLVMSLFVGCADAVIDGAGASSDVVLTELAASLSTVSISIGETKVITLTGTYSDGTSAAVTDATWESAAAGVASVASGTITGVAAGTATITATKGGKSVAVSVTVAAAIPADSHKGIFSDSHTNSTYSIGWAANGGTGVAITMLTDPANAFFGDNYLSVVFSHSVWGGFYYANVDNSGNPIAVVDASAYANGELVFTLDTHQMTNFNSIGVKVTSGTLTGGAFVDNGGGEIALSTLTPSATSGNWKTYKIPLKAFKSIAALDSSKMVLLASFWNPTKADNTVSTGTMLLDEVYFAPTIDLTLNSVTVGNASPTVSVGGTSTIVATSNFSNGTAVPLANSAVTWASDANAVATVNSAGVITGVSAGTATITGTYESKTVTISVTVTSGLVGDTNGDGKVTVYALTGTAEMAPGTIAEPGWGSGSSVTTDNYTSDVTYAKAIQAASGTGWGGTGAAVAMSFSGFTAGALANYSTLNFKVKYPETDTPQYVEVQMVGASPNQKIKYSTDATGWTPLTNGWIQLSFNLSDFGSLTSTTNFVIIMKDSTTGWDGFVTDVNFQ